MMVKMMLVLLCLGAGLAVTTLVAGQSLATTDSMAAEAGVGANEGGTHEAADARAPVPDGGGVSTDAATQAVGTTPTETGEGGVGAGEGGISGAADVPAPIPNGTTGSTDAAPPEDDGGSAKNCNAEQAEVVVEAINGGWLVSREYCGGEQAVILAYSYGSEPAKEVMGKRDGDKWVFAVPTKIPADAIVKLEFSVFSSVADAADAHSAFLEFLKSLSDAIRKSFDEADTATRGVDPATRPDVLLNQFGAKMRSRLSELAKTSRFASYYVGTRPAVDAVLSKARFRKLGANDWEPTPGVFEELRDLWGAHARKRWNAEEQLRQQPPRAQCLGDSGALAKGGTEGEGARREAVASCFLAFHDDARKVLPLGKGQDVEPALLRFDDLAKQDHSTIVAALLQDAETTGTVPTAAATPKSTSLLAPKYQQDLVDVRRAIHPKPPPAAVATTPKNKPKAAPDPTVKQADDDVEALNHAAALLVENQLRDTWAQQISAKLEPKPEELRDLRQFTRQGRASELVKVTPGKPRFFVSTGVVATALNTDPSEQPWKLSLPVLVSICWSAQGCETKGIGQGGNALNYVSTDLGVKAVFLGTRDPRESAPSFLLGLGVNPFYATHVSVGLNLFENRQTEKANLALYLAVTLDLITGSDILGELGLGKPAIQRIGGDKQ